MIVLRLLHTVVGYFLLLFATLLFAFLIGVSGETEASEKILRTWARFFLWLTGARVIVQRDSELEPGRSYVFVCNHTSNLDAPAILATTDHPLRFIAKKELQRIPLFGWAARRMGHVFIDRKDPQRATKAIRRRIDKGLAGIAMFFFAEGTRAVDDQLLPFKKGAAISAIDTGLDCVPVAIAGARDVLPPKGFALFQPGPLAVVFGKPISISGHSLDRRDELVAAQRSAVQRALDEARALVSQARRR